MKIMKIRWSIDEETIDAEMIASRLMLGWNIALLKRMLFNFKH